jgi:large subunit ribosomal protein L21
MYAIFETGGKQYKVESGDVLRVEKLADAKPGEKYKFDKVLAVNDDTGIKIGTPYLDAATVTASVIGDGKKDKVIIFKFKSKKDYRKKQGHRQPYTEIEIETVEIGGKTVIKQAPKKVEEPPAEVEAEAEDTADSEAEEKAEKPEKKPAPKAKKAPAKEADEIKKDESAEAQEAEEENVAPAETTETEVTEAAEAKAPKEVKLTKADITAKLDELDVSYLKSAKKDELLALLSEAEGAEASAEAKEEGVEIE